MNALARLTTDGLEGELKELQRFGLAADLVEETTAFMAAEESQNTFDENGKPHPRPIPPKMEFALRLYYCGLNATEACKHANVERSWFHVWLRKPEVKKLQEKVQGELEDRFMALQYKATRVIENGMDDPDVVVALKATQTWLTATRAQKHTVELTAEDIIAKLIQ